MDYDVLIVGAGFAGSTLAQKFSEDGNSTINAIKDYFLKIRPPKAVENMHIQHIKNR